MGFNSTNNGRKQNGSPPKMEVECNYINGARLEDYFDFKHHRREFTEFSFQDSAATENEQNYSETGENIKEELLLGGFNHVQTMFDGSIL